MIVVAGKLLQNQICHQQFVALLTSGAHTYIFFFRVIVFRQCWLDTAYVEKSGYESR
jgi:hypothetical protein